MRVRCPGGARSRYRSWTRRCTKFTLLGRFWIANLSDSALAEKKPEKTSASCFAISVVLGSGKLAGRSCRGSFGTLRESMQCSACFNRRCSEQCVERSPRSHTITRALQLVPHANAHFPMSAFVINSRSSAGWIWTASWMSSWMSNEHRGECEEHKKPP